MSHSPVNKYLVMTIDFSKEGKVNFTMQKYIEELINKSPNELMKGTRSTPDVAYLFEINENTTKLTDSNNSSPNCCIYASVLNHINSWMTRLQAPDVDDYKKIGRCLRYLRDSK